MKIRINSNNKQDYIKTLIESLERFINYCNDYPEEKEYNYYKNMAEIILKEYQNISLNILQFCFEPEYIGDTIYPNKTLESLYRFRQFCFNYDYNSKQYIFINDLQEQQQKAKNYIHFNFSVKRPKTLKDI